MYTHVRYGEQNEEKPRPNSDNYWNQRCTSDTNELLTKTNIAETALYSQNNNIEKLNGFYKHAGAYSCPFEYNFRS